MRVDIYTENLGCGDRWRLYVASVLPSCSGAIVAVLEQDGAVVLVTETPGRSGLGRHVYQTAEAAR